jgi:hypothetical protein
MPTPMVSMSPPGNAPITQLNLNDGTVLTFNAAPPYQVPASAVPALLAGGWTLFVAGVTTGAGTGHIP